MQTSFKSKVFFCPFLYEGAFRLNWNVYSVRLNTLNSIQNR